jgi:vancomycin permeability regulator SanA
MLLIVLGYPADADGNPSPTELARVSEGVREYERGVAPRMIMTGGAAHNRFVEAQVMAHLAEAQGIPADMIVEDPEAHTRSRMRATRCGSCVAAVGNRRK